MHLTLVGSVDRTEPSKFIDCYMLGDNQAEYMQSFDCVVVQSCAKLTQ